HGAVPGRAGSPPARAGCGRLQASSGGHHRRREGCAPADRQRRGLPRPRRAGRRGRALLGAHPRRALSRRGRGHRRGGAARGRGLPGRAGARGGAAQHSQLQLYVEGPRDKVVLFARVEDHGVTVDLPTTYQDLEGVGYLGGHSLGELLNVEQRATELALAKRGRPSATLVLPAVNAFTLGQLLYLLETATVVVGALAGIDPFGQPGVEE